MINEGINRMRAGIRPKYVPHRKFIYKSKSAKSQEFLSLSQNKSRDYACKIDRQNKNHTKSQRRFIVSQRGPRSWAVYSPQQQPLWSSHQPYQCLTCPSLNGHSLSTLKQHRPMPYSYPWYLWFTGTLSMLPGSLDDLGQVEVYATTAWSTWGVLATKTEQQDSTLWN